MPVRAKYERLCSWQTVLIATAAVWMISWFPPVFEVINMLSFEVGVLLAACYGGMFLYTVYLKRERDYERICALLMFGGLLLRAYLVLVTPYNNTNHDIGMFSAISTGEGIGDGHFGYIEYIFFHGKLPDFDPREVWGFYNPPGFYILAALVLRLTSFVQPIMEPFCFEALQCIPFFFSCMTLWTFDKILREFDIAPKYRAVIAAILSFHPFFHITASTLINDSMVMYFTALTIYLGIRWYKQQTLRNILLLGLALGLGMFTKLNAAVMAFPLAFLFAYAFFTNLKNIRAYIGQYVSFLGVCAPLGLFHPIRNAVLFGVPLTFVQRLEEGSVQHIQNATVWQRLFSTSMEEIGMPFATFNAQVEINVWVEMLRTSLFDEFISTEQGSIGLVALALFWLGMALAAVMAVVLIGTLLTSKKLKAWEKGFLGVCWGAMVVSFVSFCFSMPFVCSANYRYISTAIIFPLIALGVFLTSAEQEQERPRLYRAVTGVTTVFTLLSVAVVIWVAVFAQLQMM